MNQAVLFSDDEQFNQQQQLFIFHAQSQGQLIPCLLSVDSLVKLTEQHLETINEALALQLFEQYRFDIEELAEHKIQQQEFNQDGQIIL